MLPNVDVKFRSLWNVQVQLNCTNSLRAERYEPIAEELSCFSSKMGDLCTNSRLWREADPLCRRESMAAARDVLVLDNEKGTCEASRLLSNQSFFKCTKKRCTTHHLRARKVEASDMLSPMSRAFD